MPASIPRFRPTGSPRFVTRTGASAWLFLALLTALGGNARAQPAAAPAAAASTAPTAPSTQATKPAATPAATPAGAAAPRGQFAVSPIYSQLIGFTLPPGFKVVHENDAGTQYVREAVPEGESVEKWTQMISVTGLKGYAANPFGAPDKFADNLAVRFQRACPSSFDAVQVGQGKLSTGQLAYTALIGCGSLKSGETSVGETTLITVIQGEKDFYTVQWSERRAAREEKPDLDVKVWGPRLRALAPLRVCPIQPGEVAPYRSCTDPKPGG